MKKTEDYCGFVASVPEYAFVGANWRKKNFKYAIHEIPEQLDLATTTGLTKTAFAQWAAAAQLNFIHVPTGEEHDIRIFCRPQRMNGNDWGNVLAEGYYPPPLGGSQAGTINFNRNREWSSDTYPSHPVRSYFQVMVHEIGHVLGLDHSDLIDAVMEANYPNNGGILSQDDITGVQRLYLPPSKGSILASFTRAGGSSSDHVVHWSPDGTRLGAGGHIYHGKSKVVKMVEHNGAVLTSFRRAHDDYIVHRSPDGDNLGHGPPVYQGGGRISSMLAYKGGILTGFSDPSEQSGTIHWDPTGSDLSGGEVVYRGSPCTGMIEYEGGVLAAFSKRGRDGHVVVWSADGRGFGDNDTRYTGGSAVDSMLAFDGGILAAFNRGTNNRVVHWSPDGRTLGAGAEWYEGENRVEALLNYQGGILAAFNGPNSNASIRWSSGHGNLFSQDVRYSGGSPVTDLIIL